MKNTCSMFPSWCSCWSSRASLPSARAFTAISTPCALWALTSSYSGGAAAATGWPAAPLSAGWMDISPAIIGPQHHHGVVAVRADHTLLLRHAFHGVVQHHAERAVFQRLGGKIMAVEFFARERHKDAPGADLTAVGGHQRDRSLALGQRVDRQALQQDVCCNCFHTLIPLYPQIRCTMVPCWTLEPGASLWLWTVPEPSTVQLSPAAFSICRAKSALLPVTSGTSACLPS